MKDIQTISADYVQGSFQLLEHAGDRARASLYFARRVGEEAEKENYLMAQWYYRASLSEYKSLFDVLPADLRDINLDKIFNMSPFKKEMDSHPNGASLSVASTVSVPMGNHLHFVSWCGHQLIIFRSALTTSRLASSRSLPDRSVGHRFIEIGYQSGALCLADFPLV